MASIQAPDDLNFGEHFMFTVVPAEAKPNWMPSVSVTGSWVKFLAWRDGTLIYSEVHQPGEPFRCGPSLRWTEGGADGVGQVGHMSNRGKWITDASCEFEVLP